MPKALNVSIIVLIIVAIIFTAIMLILRYDEKGEENMPFDIKKISIISSINGQDIEDSKHLWNKSVGQDNDIYIYIEKNKDYNRTEAIKKIVINNFKINKSPTKGKISFFQPSNNEKEFFENIDKFRTDAMVFTGAQSSNLKELKISNQGGIVAFRVAIQNLGSYVSNEKILDYKDLLKKTNIDEEDIKANISFDVTMELSENIKYRTSISIDIPAEKIVENGKSSKEINGKDFVSKRVEN